MLTSSAQTSQSSASLSTLSKTGTNPTIASNTLPPISQQPDSKTPSITDLADELLRIIPGLQLCKDQASYTKQFLQINQTLTDFLNRFENNQEGAIKSLQKVDRAGNTILLSLIKRGEFKLALDVVEFIDQLFPDSEEKSEIQTAIINHHNNEHNKANAQDEKSTRYSAGNTALLALLTEFPKHNEHPQLTASRRELIGRLASFPNSLNEENQYGNALHVAAKRGLHEEVKILLNNDANILSLSKRSNMSALLLATYHGKESVTRVLLDSLKEKLTNSRGAEIPRSIRVHLDIRCGKNNKALFCASRWAQQCGFSQETMNIFTQLTHDCDEILSKIKPLTIHLKKTTESSSDAAYPCKIITFDYGKNVTPAEATKFFDAVADAIKPPKDVDFYIAKQGTQDRRPSPGNRYEECVSQSITYSDDKDHAASVLEALKPYFDEPTHHHVELLLNDKDIDEQGKHINVLFSLKPQQPTADGISDFSQFTQDPKYRRPLR